MQWVDSGVLTFRQEVGKAFQVRKAHEGVKVCQRGRYGWTGGRTKGGTAMIVNV